jgi:hypothetical protein
MIYSIAPVITANYSSLKPPFITNFKMTIVLS